MNRTSNSKSQKSYIKCVLIGTLIGIAVGAVLLFLLAAAGLSLDDPRKYAPIFALASLFAASYISGIAGAKLYGGRRSRAGLLSGLLFILAVVLVTFAVGAKLNLLLLAICVPVAVILSLLGDITGAGSPAAKRHKHRQPF